MYLANMNLAGTELRDLLAFAPPVLGLKTSTTQGEVGVSDTNLRPLATTAKAQLTRRTTAAYTLCFPYIVF